MSVGSSRIKLHHFPGRCERSCILAQRDIWRPSGAGLLLRKPTPEAHFAGCKSLPLDWHQFAAGKPGNANAYRLMGSEFCFQIGFSVKSGERGL